MASDSALARLESAIAFYDSNARRTMRWHFTLKTIEIGAAALVPVAALASISKYFAAGLGAVVIISERIDALHHYGDHRTAWRFVAEQLIYERDMFTEREGPYYQQGDEAARHLLVSRTETLTAQERTQWLALEQKPDAQQGKNANGG